MKSILASKPEHESIDPYKILYNTGCSMIDMSTGTYVRGMKGENLLNGGFGALIAMVGRPNVFKSTIAYFMMLAGAHNIADAGYEPYMNTYDTEMNIHTSRLLALAQKFIRFAQIDVIMTGIWKITDATKHLGEDWYKKLKDYLREEKIKNRKKYLFPTPFIDKKGEPIYTIFPTFGQLDSITKFVTSDIEEISNKNEIGDSGGNMIFARSGLGKARLLMELPGLCNAAAHYMICTAHVADINMMGLQPHQQPAKKLQHMRTGEKVKGVPDDFLYLTNSLWQATSSVVLFNNGTKVPEYPKTRDSKDEESVDLNRVTMKLIRNKSGPSGYTFDLLVSQVDGVLSSLSEFHCIKENGRFGLEGNNTNYHLVLLPEVNITRTTIRELLDTNPKLRRAVKITTDIYHISLFYKDLPFEIPSMTDLYSKLEKEFGWDVLLETRDNWTFNQYEHETPFLSAMDILELYYGIQKAPYWYKKEKVAK